MTVEDQSPYRSMIVEQADWWTSVPPCRRCNQVHLQPWVRKTGERKASCTAHRSQRDPDTGSLIPCAAPPLRGLDVCRTHGGKSKAAREAAARRMRDRADRENQEKALAAAARIFGVPREVDPAIGLIEEYWRCAGLVDAYERLAAQLDPDELTFGLISETTKVTRTGQQDYDATTNALVDRNEIEVKTTRVGRVPVVVKLLNEERERFAKLGVEIVKLGLEARRDEYVRAQVDVFAGVLDSLNLTEEQRLAAATALRALDGRMSSQRVVDGTLAIGP